MVPHFSVTDGSDWGIFHHECPKFRLLMCPRARVRTQGTYIEGLTLGCPVEHCSQSALTFPVKIAYYLLTHRLGSSVVQLGRVPDGGTDCYSASVVPAWNARSRVLSRGAAGFVKRNAEPRSRRPKLDSSSGFSVGFEAYPESLG